MTQVISNEQILKKAIEKVQKNGWSKEVVEIRSFWLCEKAPVYFAIIFSHDFAKAFWGDKNKRALIECATESQFLETEYFGWEFHLQQMVLEVEPLRYLEKFLC